ncbi:hypothetical protein V6M93_03180 [Pectobacterium brasiliense]|uniref:hypothetical protein n=1 Tax=Pectobacterium brasiliense TaxID=180957 RepID=UPI002A81EF15|nr:hypothetical protein [Pectobacterium brasiliense]MDY4323837.1 hypothetical protein [Pectobacterium brasiliense]
MIMACRHCGLPLNKGLPKIKDNVAYKSCPKCSVTQGQQHVYFPAPDDFGTTTARETSNNPDGVQSYCESCRPPSEKGNPSWVFQNGTTCGDFD